MQKVLQMETNFLFTVIGCFSILLCSRHCLYFSEVQRLGKNTQWSHNQSKKPLRTKSRHFCYDHSVSLQSVFAIRKIFFFFFLESNFLIFFKSVLRYFIFSLCCHLLDEICIASLLMKGWHGDLCTINTIKCDRSVVIRADTTSKLFQL